MSELIGRTIGQYEITALLGKGGMATVYKARQVSIGRDVALKIIDPGLGKNADFIKRFEREARTIASLSHAHILKVFDYGQQSGLVYLVMELLRGGSLGTILKRGRIPLNIISWLLDQIASALDYAHARGIVHRDLKPHNLLFDDSRNIFLTDFGLAKLLDMSSGELTRTGLVVGTPAYMAPEQWKNETVDHRADIYSLGILLFEMLTGKLPFTADTPHRMMYQHLNNQPPPVLSLRSDLPAVVSMVIDQALAKDPGARFSSAGRLASAFKRALSTTEVVSPRQPTALLPPQPTEGQSPINAGGQPAMPEAAPAADPRVQMGRTVTLSPEQMAAQESAQAVPASPGIKRLTLTPGMRRVDPRSISQVWVPSGIFTMGTNTDRDARVEEQPEHPVTLTYGFWIDQYPVTNEAFQAFVDDGGYMKRQHWTNDGWRWLQNNGIQGPGNYPNFMGLDQPRVGVSWFEADAYANWRGGRLPTEAEWEYAARGSLAVRYPWGNVFEANRANVKSRSTTAVNSYPDGSSWVKAFDMAGNVWEWCADWFGEAYYTREKITDPHGPPEGKGRVLRGGSWRQDAVQARCTARRYDAPISRDDYIGFRIVTLPTK